MKKIYPSVKISYDLKLGIKKILYDLKKHNVTEKKFISYKYYRIQTLKKVIKTL